MIAPGTYFFSGLPLLEKPSGKALLFFQRKSDAFFAPESFADCCYRMERKINGVRHHSLAGRFIIQCSEPELVKGKRIGKGKVLRRRCAMTAGSRGDRN